MTETNMVPVVTNRDGVVTTNSRDVAEFFGKRHADVLRAIDDLGCSPKFAERNFALCNYIRDLGDGIKRTYRSIDMTKDGFTFLVMGFTGSAAAEFKEAYIERFNEMEAEIHDLEAEVASLPTRAPEELAIRLVAETRRTFGHKSAQQLWGELGLPVVPAMLAAPQQVSLFN